tara:strand:+ start:712 stop:1209 length:498 start_codon:yes stop_codon:yes gene_type:complete
MRNNKFTLQGLAHISEFFGAIAIIISLVYLIIQVSDHNRSLRSQSHYNALVLEQGPVTMMVQNPELSILVGQCKAGQDDLSSAILARCNHYTWMELNAWEYLYYQHLDNSIPPELWLGSDAYYRNEVQTKAGYAKFWKDYHIAYAEPFHSYVVELFPEESDFSPQ